MADNLTTQSGTPATVPSASVIATDDVTGVHFQKVKLDVGGDGVSVPATGDGTNGLDVDVTRVQGTVAVTGPLTDTQIRATALPVSGTVTATGPLTDTQLRAATVPVSGTIAIDQTTNGTTNRVNLAPETTKVIGTVNIAPSQTIGVTGVPAAITGFATSTIQTDGTQKSKVTDGTRDATVKAASTAAVAADTALVVAISPNNSLNVANAPIANMVKGVSTATNGTSAFQVVALVASKQLAITSISVANTGNTATLITIQDGTSPGTALYATMAPPGGGSNITLPTPILTSVGNALYAQCSAASASVTVCAAGYSV